MFNFLKQTKLMKGQIIINGNSYVGNNVTIKGNKVIIDGKDCTPDSKDISIKIEGNINEISVDYCDSFDMVGDANKVTTTNGNIQITGAVSGDVTTTNGNISCAEVKGSVKTHNGNIKHK